MILRTLKKGLILTMYLMLISCAGKVTYNYNNVEYESPETALESQKAEIDTILNKITPTSYPIGGSAVVVLPSKLYAEKNFIVWKGPEPSEEQKVKSTNYIANIILNNWRSRGEALQKRRIFNRVIITNDDDPENASFNEDIAIVLFKKEGKEQWFLRKKDANTILAIEEVSTAFPKFQRLMWWLDNVEKMARGK